MFKDTKAYSSYSVDNLPKARDFYTNILGLTVTEDQGLLILHISGGARVLIYPKSDHVPAIFTVLNFSVPNIEMTVDALSQKGIQFEHYGGDIETDDKGISHKEPATAWFKDPAGNILAVVQEKNSSQNPQKVP